MNPLLILRVLALVAGMTSQVLTQVGFWATNALEGILLFRAFRGHYFWKYPVFYLYLSYVLSSSLVGYGFYLFHPSLYASTYWSVEFASVLLGYGVIWEIFRQTLRDYHGAARVARVCLALLFIGVTAKLLVDLFGHSVFAPNETLADLERYFRVIQVILLAVAVGLFTYYSIPIGRNTKGMIFGYGMFIGLTIMHLTLRSYLGDSFQPIWQHMGWASYSVALIVWCTALWTYAPNPRPANVGNLQRDYERMAVRTARLMEHVRSGLVRAIRS